MAFVNPEHAERAPELMRGHPLGEAAAIIGQVQNETKATLCSRIGATRIVDLLSGKQLPRLC